MFTLTLEYVFKNVQWENKDFSTNGERLNHLKDADDIVIIAEYPAELQTVPTELDRVIKPAWKWYFKKNKIQTEELENIDSYVYLGDMMTLGRENQT